MLPFSITMTSYSAPSSRSTTSASITIEAIVPASLKHGKKGRAESWPPAPRPARLWPPHLCRGA